MLASVIGIGSSGHDLAQGRAQLLAHLLGGLADVAGQQRLAGRLGVLANSLFIHQLVTSATS